MSFKDVIASDVHDTFMNADEFSDMHGSQMKKCRRSSPQRKSQRFQCLHRNPDNTCRRTYEPCTESCRYFGTCGECVAYFIPAGQQPCRSCNKLNAGGR